MVSLRAVQRGMRLALRTKRMVILAWVGSLLVSLPPALSLLWDVEAYVGGTAIEERLLERLDDNALATMKMDRPGSEILESLDYTMLGWAPFLDAGERLVRGTGVRALGGFLSDLFFRWEIRTEAMSLLTMLTLIYVLFSTFLAGGFLGLYGREPDGDTAQFLRYGAKYFGRFFRLSLLALILYALFFGLVASPLHHAIPQWTRNAPSELTPFLYYMVNNVGVAMLLALFMMSFDYAKVRIVIEDRSSAVAAAAAGFGFAFRNIVTTGSLHLVLVAVAVLLMVLYGLLESLLPQSTYGSILAAFALSQMYMILRWWLRAVWFAAETELCRTLTGSREAPSREPAALSR